MGLCYDTQECEVLEHVLSKLALHQKRVPDVSTHLGDVAPYAVLDELFKPYHIHLQVFFHASYARNLAPNPGFRVSFL